MDKKEDERKAHECIFWQEIRDEEDDIEGYKCGMDDKWILQLNEDPMGQKDCPCKNFSHTDDPVWICGFCKTKIDPSNEEVRNRENAIVHQKCFAEGVEKLKSVMQALVPIFDVIEEIFQDMTPSQMLTFISVVQQEKFDELEKQLKAKDEKIAALEKELKSKEYCRKCGLELIEGEKGYCIPYADDISGNLPTPEERHKYSINRETEGDLD